MRGQARAIFAPPVPLWPIRAIVRMRNIPVNWGRSVVNLLPADAERRDLQGLGIARASRVTNFGKNS